MANTKFCVVLIVRGKICFFSTLERRFCVFFNFEGAAPHGAVHDDPLRVAGSDARAFAVELKPKDGRLGPRYGMRSAHGVVLGDDPVVTGVLIAAVLIVAKNRPLQQST